MPSRCVHVTPCHLQHLIGSEEPHAICSLDVAKIMTGSDIPAEHPSKVPPENRGVAKRSFSPTFLLALPFLCILLPFLPFLFFLLTLSKAYKNIWCHLQNLSLLLLVFICFFPLFILITVRPMHSSTNQQKTRIQGSLPFHFTSNTF